MKTKTWADWMKIISESKPWSKGRARKAAASSGLEVGQQEMLYSMLARDVIGGFYLKGKK